MTGEIPQRIKTLDNQKVAVRGFMLPLKQENGLATDFILLRNRMMCCYGMMPKVNEWIHVRMGGNGVRCIMDIPVTISGKLHVEEYRENRTMLGIYRLDGEKLEAPGDSLRRRPDMKRQKIRKAKALAAANRQAYLGLAIGAAAGIALFAMALLCGSHWFAIADGQGAGGAQKSNRIRA